MTEFLIYQGKIAVLLTVFHMFYRLLLSKDTHHRLNRIVLLGTATLSCILPACVITIRRIVFLPAREEASELSHGVTGGGTSVLPGISEPVWQYTLCSILTVGALVVLLMSIMSITRIMRIIRNGESSKLESGETLVITDRDTVPFSWMKYIVLSREDYEGSHTQILTHEKAHISLKHSWDIIFLDFITALQWFNPAIWMIKSDLRAIHEFEADDAVLRSGVNIKEYQYLLIRKAISKSGYSVANSFNHSSLKKRISMMQTARSPRRNIWKACYIILIAGISLASSAETRKITLHYHSCIDNSDIVQVSSYHKSDDSWIKKNAHEMKITPDPETNTVKINYYNKYQNPLESTISGVDFNNSVYICDNMLISKNEAAKLTGRRSLIYGCQRMVYVYHILENGNKVHVYINPTSKGKLETIALENSLL